MTMNILERAWLVSLAAVLAGGCVESSERCGANMDYEAAQHLCVCSADAVAVAGGCQACAADEVVVGTACACGPGQAKNDADVCTVVAGLADPCSAAAPCTDSTYAFCAPPTAGATAGTCTKTCASDDDCGAAYTCATWEAEPYCRQFSGVGTACAAPSDCSSLDAQTCDTVQSHACVVAGCTLDDGDCPRGTQCCDLSAFGAGTVCMGGCP